MTAAFVVVFSLFAVIMAAVVVLIVRSAIRRDRARNQVRRAASGSAPSVDASSAPGGPRPLSP
jgi:hypothetical protein